MGDILKAATFLFSFLLLAPLFGYFAAKSRSLEKFLFILMVSFFTFNGAQTGYFFFPIPHVRTWMPGAETLFAYPIAFSLLLSVLFRKGISTLKTPRIILGVWLLFYVAISLSAAFSTYPSLSLMAVFQIGRAHV